MSSSRKKYRVRIGFRPSRRLLICSAIILPIVAALIGFAYGYGGIQNPSDRVIVEPAYVLVHSGYPQEIVTDDEQGLLIFENYDGDGSETRLTTLSFRSATVIKEQILSDFHFAKDKYLVGPVWANGEAAFAVIGRHDQVCSHSYSAKAPDWNFVLGSCSRDLASRTSTESRSKALSSRTRKPGLPENADMRGLGSVWGYSSTGLFAADAFDRYLRAEGSPRAVADVRLFTSDGCTIAQIGTRDHRDGQGVYFIGWTEDDGLLVRLTAGKDKQPGVYLVEGSTIRELIRQSECS